MSDAGRSRIVPFSSSCQLLTWAVDEASIIETSHHSWGWTGVVILGIERGTRSQPPQECESPAWLVVMSSLKLPGTFIYSINSAKPCSLLRIIALATGWPIWKRIQSHVKRSTQQIETAAGRAEESAHTVCFDLTTDQISALLTVSFSSLPPICKIRNETRTDRAMVHVLRVGTGSLVRTTHGRHGEVEEPHVSVVLDWVLVQALHHGSIAMTSSTHPSVIHPLRRECIGMGIDLSAWRRLGSSMRSATPFHNVSAAAIAPLETSCGDC